MIFFLSLFFCQFLSHAAEEYPLCWPPPPAQTRISFIRSVYSPADIGIKQGWVRKLKAVVFGAEKQILNKPIAVAVDRQKTIYVCDAGVPALHIFGQKEKQYKKLTAINKEKLLLPVGVAVSEKDLIFLADSALKKVFCLDKNGKLKFILGEGRFTRPTGLAISKERVYVVDTLEHSILVFDLRGNFMLQFGGRGKEEGKFNYPTSIVADAEGKIYVADTLNFRIQVFDQTNKFLYCIGQIGDSSGSFARPKGVAVDSFGHIYTTDAIFDNIQIFNREKEFLLALGEPGNKNGEFWIPSGMSIDKDNYIYVADSYNQRIQIFQYVGKE